jgi:hypothetical protein
MRLDEILLETTDESIMLSDISSKIIDYIIQNDIHGNIGQIGNLVNDKSVPTDLQKVSLFVKPEKTYGAGFGIYGHDYETANPEIYINDIMFSKYPVFEIKRVLEHELRHALDFIKSKSKDTYPTKNKKQKRSNYLKKSKDYTDAHSMYQSSKSEINARSQEAMNSLKNFIEEHSIETITTNQLARLVNRSLEVNDIAKYYSNGTQDKEYRRLFNRVLDYGTRYLTVV